MDNITGIVKSGNSNVWSAPQTLLSAAQTLTDSFADCGTEVNARGFRNVKFFVTMDINGSNNPRFKVLGKHTYSTGTEEYPLSSGKVTVLTNNTYTAAAASRYFELDDDADQLFVIDVQVDNTIDSLQLQACVGTVGSPAAQVDALYCLRGC
jgi:hypothetical protein